jgi:hypothetical protein
LNSHRKRVIGAGFVVAMVCVFLSARYFNRPARNEPVYQGKTPTKWLKRLDNGRSPNGISSSQLVLPTPAQLEAIQAIHAMGTNALPWLMLDIHAQPGTNSRGIRFHRWTEKHLPGSISRRFDYLETTEEDWTRWRAAQGLSALGPLAKPALPELKRLLYTNYWHSSIQEAAYALAAIDPEGIEILTNAVQPQTEWSGMCAIWALGQHPAAGARCIPFLIQATASKSEGTAMGAIEVLGLFHADPGHVIPALTNLLASTNAELSQRAARSLGQFGPQASSALPLLRSMTSNAAVRDAALHALQEIQ